MVYGPAQTHRLRLAGGGAAIVRGGGNLMCIPTLLSDRTYFQANIWDYAGPVYYNIDSAWVRGESYSILGSAGITLNEPDSDVMAEYVAWNNGYSVTFDSTHSGSWSLVAQNMFNYIGFYPYYGQQAKRVTLGATQFAPVIGFTNLDLQNEKYPVTMERIVRLESVGSINGDIRTSLNMGYVTARNDVGTDPIVFGNVKS